jgi:hypothetical protein
MAKQKKLTWEDHTQLLEYLLDHSLKQASLKFDITEGAIRNRLYNIRKKLQAEQAAINRIRTLQRISPRIRKMTTIGGVPEEEELP